jgi:small subunit ribosomal protein S9
MDSKKAIKKIHKIAPGKRTVRKAAAKKSAAPAAITAEPKEVQKPEFKNIPANKTYYSVGKRKTAVAQVLVNGGNGTISINNVSFETYFPSSNLQYIVRQPLSAMGLDKSVNIKAKIHSGGIHAQAEAMRHAVSRALTLLNPESRRTLKKLGFLTRDPRVKERKKPGLKRARRAPQFSKR